jgi:hypothetical protein
VVAAWTRIKFRSLGAASTASRWWRGPPSVETRRVGIAGSERLPECRIREYRVSPKQVANDLRGARPSTSPVAKAAGGD